MNIDEFELEKEKKHLGETVDYISSLIDEKNVNIDEYKNKIVENKKFLWQNLSDFKDVEMYSSMDEENLNVNLINKDIVKVYKLYRSKETPYFSRISFQIGNSSETYYIGLTGVDRDYDPIIYDWRAPIANLYYNYGIGHAKYETGVGTVEGNITLKRQFEIKMGEICSVYDSTTDAHDHLLESVLSGNSSEQMRNIVHTIQSEQNEIIRYGGSSSIVVEGVAGSGKTSVALHRIAYLLYNQKGLTNKNVLIMSPSTVFTNYISNVLPELGEENVLSTTFDDFASNYIKGVKVESITEFIERHYENKDREDWEKIAFKMSDGQRKKLDEFLEKYYDDLMFTKKIGLKTKFIMSSELNTIKNSAPKNISVYDKFGYLADKICSKFGIDEIKNSPRFRDIIFKLLKIETDPIKLYEKFLDSEIGECVNYEDIFSVLYLFFEVSGYPSMSHIKVVVIDEAQDYSLWQFRFLKSMFNRAVFTILGDKNQRINPFVKYDSLEEITTVFKNSKYRMLENTYRSSKEIIEFSNRILGIDGINSIRPSNGIEVEIKDSIDLVGDVLSSIHRFNDMGYKRIAVITKTSDEAKRLKSSTSSLEIEFVPVYLAKGLEYDAVIVATEKEDAFTKDEANLFYVATTRALHALVVYNQNF